MSSEKTKNVQLKLKDINKKTFETKSFKENFQAVLKKNERLMDYTKVDTESLSKRFEV